MSDICSSVTAEQTIRLGRLPEIFADDLIDMSAGGPTLTGAEARRHFVERVARTHERFHPHLLIHIDQIQVAGNWVYQHGSLVVTLVPKGGAKLPLFGSVTWRFGAASRAGNGKSRLKWIMQRKIRTTRKRTSRKSKHPGTSKMIHCSPSEALAEIYGATSMQTSTCPACERAGTKNGLS